VSCLATIFFVECEEIKCVRKTNEYVSAVIVCNERNEGGRVNTKHCL